MSDNIWRGQKVRLRPIEQKDLDALITSPEEPDTEIDRYEDHIHFPHSQTQGRDELAKLGQPRDDDTYFWMIEDHNGNHVGYINTFDTNRRVGTFKYAIIIKRPYWGNGYGPDAIKILLRYYFRERRYQKCTVLIYSFNQRSLHLHQKLGFQLEGRLRRMAYTNGNYYDEIYYGLTAEEFDQIEPKLNLQETMKKQTSTQPEKNVTYYVNEDKPTNSAKIHRSDCPYGTPQQKNPKDGRWHGPFESFALALETAQKTGLLVSNCGYCLKK